jgi:hypothetical protein
VRLPTVLCLVLGLTACSGSSAPPPAASAASSPSASPRASEAASPSAEPSVQPSPTDFGSPSPGAEPLVLAVADKKGGLSLYAVPPGEHTASLFRRLEGPAKKVVAAVSLSQNAAPTVCAVWRSAPSATADTSSELICYPPSVDRGRQIAGDVLSVGVRADGRAVAWVEYNTDSALVIADVDPDSGEAKERSRMHYAPGAPPGGMPEGIADVDWLGPRRLAVNDVGDSDEGKGLCLVDLDKPRPKSQVGFSPCVTPGPAEQRAGYVYFEQAVPVSGSEAVVVERARNCCGDDDAKRPGARAVRIRFSDGAVLGVLATPRAGRDVVDVSGRASALLYTTAVNFREQLVVSLRWAGETRGAPLTGLPADLVLATAQP